MPYPTSPRRPGLMVEAGPYAPALYGLFGLMWALEGADVLVLDGALDRFGIVPRTLWGLICVPVAPLLHFGFLHILANTLFGWQLAAVTLRHSPGVFAQVTLAAGLLGGLGTWLFGADGSIHAGFSSVLFGYLGMMLGRGMLRLGDGGPIVDARSLLPAVVISLLPGVSLTGHLFGFLGGFAVALLRRAFARRPGSPDTR